MVQTLGTLMMTYVSKPSTSDCLEVSRTLHKKFKFLEADGSSEVKCYLINVMCLLFLSLRTHGNGFSIIERRM